MSVAAKDGGDAYDAVLIQSFGGPNGPDDVDSFLANVLRGREVNEDRLAEVRARYLTMGGVSPITAQTHALGVALSAELTEQDLRLPVYVGARNWHPYLADTVATMHADGVRRALVVVTSAYASYSGCRQYSDDRDRACAQASVSDLVLDRVRHYFDHPGFIDSMTDNVVEALDSVEAGVSGPVRLVFTTHSLPQVLADTSGPPEFHGLGSGGAYVAQHLAAAHAVVERVAEIRSNAHDWELAFQSRSGAPSTPWLEPDVTDRLVELAADGVAAVVLVPIGFVSDHMEVVWDLDVEAAAVADKLGLVMARATTVGASARFVAGLVELISERLAPASGRGTPLPGRACSPLGPSWDVCAATCCPRPVRARPEVSR